MSLQNFCESLCEEEEKTRGNNSCWTELISCFVHTRPIEMQLYCFIEITFVLFGDKVLKYAQRLKNKKELDTIG